MTHREHQLLETLQRFREECRQLHDEINQLWQANVELCVERDATDVLLGEAMRQLGRMRRG
jgi:hypothetical protein